MVQSTLPRLHTSGVLYLRDTPASLPIPVQVVPAASKPLGAHLQFFKSLQLPEYEGSTDTSSYRVEHPGFEWNPETGLVSLSDTDREKTLLAIDKVLASSAETAMDPVQLQQVFSKLLHACHIVALGRPHIWSLAKALLDQKQTLARSIELQSCIRSDLSWWRKLLRMSGDVTRVDDLKKAMVNSIIYTDASTQNGCAIVVDSQWRNWRWRDGFIPDTNWAEAIAVEMAVRYLVTQPRKSGKSHFRILCDSQAVGLIWSRGGSNNLLINRVILSIVDTLVQHNCWLSLKWIPSGQNLADGPSRFKADDRIGQQLECDTSFVPQAMQAHFRDIN